MTQGKFTMVENPVPWPNGARCAVSFTWDMDADSILHLAHPDDADTRLMSMTDLRYGPEVAVPRICRMFEAYDIPLSSLVRGGAPPGRRTDGRGRPRDSPSRLDARASQHVYPRPPAVLVGAFLREPEKTHRPGAAGLSRADGFVLEYTTEFLTDLGFLYDSTLKSDDVPYVVQDQKGNQLIEMPPMWSLDDWPHYVHSPDLDYMMPILAPARAREV